MTDATLPALPMQPETNYTVRRWLRLLAFITRPMRHAWRARTHKATPEEQAARLRAKAAAADQRQIEKQLDALAKDYRRLLINALTRVGASKITKEDGKQVIKAVRFHKPALVTPEAIYFQVDTNHLPHRVKLSDLYDPENVETLMAATNRVVHPIWDTNAPEKGFWYMLELKAGVRGIPRHVEYSEILKAMPKSAGRFTVPVGRGIAGEPVFADLTEMPHLLIGGATGQGKSVWVEQTLMTLVMRNTPKQLELYIVDLKGGVELGQFKNIPHLKIPVIKYVEKVVPLLKFAKQEIMDRLELFEANGVVDISGWNQTKRNKKARILIVIDELAELMLTGEKEKAEPLLARIAALGRGAGVHLIVATQRPESRIITGLIKANFPTRLAFSCAGLHASMSILDTGDAAGLRPEGRMIYLRGSKKTELQGPYVSPKIISETVGEIIGGKAPEALAKRRRHDLTPEDFFRHAIERYPGRFPIRPIYEDLKIHGVTKEELLELARSLEGQEIEVDGDIYFMTGPTLEGAKESRKLTKIKSRETDDTEDNEYDAQPTPEERLAEFQPIQIGDDLQMAVLPDASEPGEEADLSEDETFEE